jgi:CBS domain containing-hemolysin-like protein
VDIRTLWITFFVILFFDSLVVLLRAALVHTRLPQLLSLAAQADDHHLDPLLDLLKKPAFRLGLRLLIAMQHFMLGACVWLLLTYYLPLALLWLGLLAAVLTALLVLLLEVSLEGAVRREPETWFYNTRGLIRALEVLLRPFSALLLALQGSPLADGNPPGMTEDELKNWVEAGQSAGGLEKGERQMIYSIFHFGDTLCREIMVPRIDLLALEAGTTVPEAVKALTVSGHSRVPVYEETIDNVIGLLYAKDLLRASLDSEEPENIRPFLRPAYFVPEAKKVDELLREMQSHSIHLAIVVDEYGGMAGLVTLEDIVEEIVGEIRDEYDQGEDYLYQQISEDEFLLSGRIDLYDVNELLGTHLDTDLADTLGGYIYGVIGRVPSGGEAVEVENWSLTIEIVSGRRIRKVRACRLTPTQTAPEAENEH